MLSSASVCQADEMYTGGVTVDIDYEIYGYLWIEEATVNLYPGARIINDYYMGDVYAASGSVLNIYGGDIDNMLIVTTAYTDLPDAQVTVYGTDFAIDGLPVDPSVTELFLEDQVLSGVYENGSAFAYRVDCYYDTSHYLTFKIHWVDAAPPAPDPEPDIEASVLEADFGRVEVDAFAEVLVAVSNTGTAPLTISSLTLEQEDTLQFYTTALQLLPLILDPNDSVEIGLLFAPVVSGQAEAVLTLQSDDPDEGQLAIVLTGEGYIRLTPAEQIAAILDFFDESVENGTIEAMGRGRAALWQVGTVKNMLKAAQHLIQREKYPMAIQVLKVVAMKTDGDAHPWDFVTGQAVPELNEKVSALIEDLKTQ